MKVNTDVKYGVFGLSVAALGCVGLGYGLASGNKLKQVANKLDKSVDNLVKDVIDIDIPDEVVEKAVKKAAAREVEVQVKRATDRAVERVRSDSSLAITENYLNILTCDIEKNVGKFNILQEFKKESIEMR